jgi:hypothetical protein
MILAAFWLSVQVVSAQIELPSVDPTHPIRVTAQSAHRWRQGGYDVWLLEGNCLIEQGPTAARSRQAVLWVKQGESTSRSPTKVIVYLEGGVVMDYRRSGAGGSSAQPLAGRATDSRWFGRFYTRVPIQMRVPSVGGELAVKPAIYQRGMARFDPEWAQSVQTAQFAEPIAAPTPTQPLPPGTRRIRLVPRSEVLPQVNWSSSPTGDEWVGVAGPGVNLIVDGLDMAVEGFGTVNVIDIETDWLVIWTAGVQPDMSGRKPQDRDTPFEVYMEGHIVFRQGERTIYANQMYYDVRRNVGVILDAEILTPVPEYEGLVRLKAKVLRQLDESRFIAQDATLTSSRLAEPSYQLKSAIMGFQDIQYQAIDPVTGVPEIDPRTRVPRIKHQRLATSRSSVLYLGRVPVFYWPTLATDLEQPQYYINNFSVKNDSVFGTQILTGLDAYQLLGIRNPPAGTNWDISLDYLSKRGFGYGTSFDYDRPGLLTIPGPTKGRLDAWFIDDSGTDNLGRLLRSVPPEVDYRGRVFWNHRQQLPRNFTLSAELGWISDRNFLDQYFEREWDLWKDQSTDIQLEQTFDNQSWSVLASYRLNDFFTQTEYLPRGDHFWLGQSLLGNRLTWFEHSHATYARLRTASEPTDPQQAALWVPLPWEPEVEGERLATRQEIDLPLQLGLVKVVPYALGELAHWGSDIDGDSIDRAYFQAGFRASVPFWTVNPLVENQLLNIHGLAHKVVLDTDVLYADSNRDLDQFPLYDPINDNSIQAFQRMFPITTFGGTVPPQDNPLFYGMRSGLQGWVSSPSTEIVDDLTAVRMGMRHRWQTKRGVLGKRRIIDWVTLDSHAVWYPDADRDNFGSSIGLVNYDFKWHVGDRTTIVSDGEFDFFTDGLRTVSVGGFLTRPPRGGAYIGYRSFTSPFNSDVLNASYAYWMSPKWVSTLGASIDFGAIGNVGSTFSVTRIGESLLVSLAFRYDASKDVTGVSFMVEPRFLPKTQLSNTPGLRILDVGAFGLE